MSGRVRIELARPHHVRELAAADPAVFGDLPMEQLEPALRMPNLQCDAVRFDGRVVGLFGIITDAPGRGHCFAFTGQVPLRAWPEITRAARAVLDTFMAQDFRRIDCYVRENFQGGIRWAERLGFTREGAAMQCWCADGSAAVRYVRTNPALAGVDLSDMAMGAR